MITPSVADFIEGAIQNRLFLQSIWRMRGYSIRPSPYLAGEITMIDAMAMSAERPGNQRRRQEKRGQRTIKHEDMTDELWGLCQRAAKGQGQGVMKWICDTVLREAERELGMNPPPPTREALAQVLAKLGAIERRLPIDKGASDSPCLLGRLFSEKKDG
jgi:hypothetical protein